MRARISSQALSGPDWTASDWLDETVTVGEIRTCWSVERMPPGLGYPWVVALERITVDPTRMQGRPCSRDLRVTVAMVPGQLAAGHTFVQVLADYPYLEREDISLPSSTQRRSSMSAKCRPFDLLEAAARRQPVAQLEIRARGGRPRDDPRSGCLVGGCGRGPGMP